MTTKNWGSVAACSENLFYFALRNVVLVHVIGYISSQTMGNAVPEGRLVKEGYGEGSFVVVRGTKPGTVR